MTVVETPGFLRDAATAMAESERDEVVSFLAANPDAGDVMPIQEAPGNSVGERQGVASGEDFG